MHASKLLSKHEPSSARILVVFMHVSFPRCDAHNSHWYTRPILTLSLAPANETIVMQFGFDEWDAAIESCITCSYNGHEEPAVMNTKERIAEKLLRALIKSAKSRKGADAWERGCLKAARTGCAKALHLLYTAEKVKVQPAYLLRSAADGGHWEIVEYIMGQNRLPGKQDQRVAMYRSLYMIQQGSLRERWDIVEQVIEGWRAADKTELFLEKWKIASEMACKRGGLGMLTKLFELRNDSEKITHVATLNMLALALSGSFDSLVSFLIENTPENSTGILNGLPEGKDRLRTVFLRFCKTPSDEIIQQLSTTRARQGTTEEVDVTVLVANIVRHVLAFGGIDKTDPEVQATLRTLIESGNSVVGKVLQDNDVQFEWMESSAVKPSTPAPCGVEAPDSFVGESSANMKQNEYSTMLSAMGFVDEHMISFEDFEVI
jgi:hypothetical protein